MATPIQPTRLRPYGSPDQAGAESRSASFGTGITGDDPGNSPTSAGQDTVNLNSQQLMAQVPQGVRPTSVLQPIESNPGGLGMSAADAARRTVTGQYLGSVNGTSQSNFEPAAILRMSGLAE